VEDELSLVTFYLTKVPQLCKAFGFGDAVCSTAMTYLKRFYTNNTCMDYHPKNVMCGRWSGLGVADAGAG
jgi:cyclin H